jgi:ribonuclease D
VGLADLVAERLGVTLDKAPPAVRLLLASAPAEMRRYIADDVRYLTELGRLVSAAVVAADIVEEVALDCERLTDEAVGGAAVAPLTMKIPRTLPPAEQAFQLAASTRLHALRLAWAEASDVPMGRMLSNAAIQELVTRPPKDRKALSRTPGCGGRWCASTGTRCCRCSPGSARRPTGASSRPASPDARPGRRRREEALKELRSARAPSEG